VLHGIRIETRSGAVERGQEVQRKSNARMNHCSNATSLLSTEQTSIYIYMVSWRADFGMARGFSDRKNSAHG